MKHKIIITISIIFAVLPNSIMSQEQKESPKFSMQTYYFVLLKQGTYKAKDTTESKQLTAGHMANIMTMFNAGKLKLAGPFLEEGKYIGLFILNVATDEEAKELLQTDPAIKAGSFDYELMKWYGPVGLKVEADK